VRRKSESAEGDDREEHCGDGGLTANEVVGRARAAQLDEPVVVDRRA